MYIETVIGECSIDGKAGIKATYWNNREFDGEAVATEQMTNPIQSTTDGQHEFGPGVHLQDFWQVRNGLQAFRIRRDSIQS